MTLNEYRILLTRLVLIRPDGSLDAAIAKRTTKELNDATNALLAKHPTLNDAMQYRTDDGRVDTILVRTEFKRALINELSTLPEEDQFTYMLVAGYPE
ncbi:hypothetical protein ACK3YP_04765 [Aeromonas allosaccharophila]|uniref:hypothetical protein n=1 Tax=Aeromonas allosaccharophila TaxID=656 RepID=UPI0039883C1E